MSSKQLSAGNLYSGYIKKTSTLSWKRDYMVFQKEDEQGERMECLVEVKVEWLDSVGREGRGDRGKKGRSQLHIGFVLFPGCCCAEAHISQAIMIDSFAISLGACAWGNGVLLAHMPKSAFPC